VKVRPQVQRFLTAPPICSSRAPTSGYDPVLGRFLSLDPVFDPADPQSLNGYGYANGNPATFSDPTGLYACLPGECGKTEDGRSTPSTGDTAPLPRVDAGSGGRARAPRFCDGCAGLVRVKVRPQVPPYLTRSYLQFRSTDFRAGRITQDQAVEQALRDTRMSGGQGAPYCTGFIDYYGWEPQHSAVVDFVAFTAVGCLAGPAGCGLAARTSYPRRNGRIEGGSDDGA
jgi:hypothetical protein